MIDDGGHLLAVQQATIGIVLSNYEKALSEVLLQLLNFFKANDILKFIEAHQLLDGAERSAVSTNILIMLAQRCRRNQHGADWE